MVELLVVIALLGILAAVAIPQLVGFLHRGEDEAAATEFVIVQKAVYTYMAEARALTIAPQAAPVQLEAGVGAIGAYLTSDTAYTYSWDEYGRVTQGERAG